MLRIKLKEEEWHKMSEKEELTFSDKLGKAGVMGRLYSEQTLEEGEQ